MQKNLFKIIIHLKSHTWDIKRKNVNNGIQHVRRRLGNYKQKIRLSNPKMFQNIQSNLLCTTLHLRKEEKNALSYGLKNPVPHRLNRNGIDRVWVFLSTNHLSHYSSRLEQEELKCKGRRICENYIKIRIPYKYKTVIQKYRRTGACLTKSG